MKDKFYLFSKLPFVLQGSVGGFVPTRDAAAFAASSRGLFAALQQPHALPMLYRKTMQFLDKIIQGKHEQVQMMLRNDIRLFCSRAKVTDSSGREFNSISGFEYALWALDKHQWDEMLACLPRDEAGHLTEDGRGIVAELQRQYVHVKTRGVTYMLNGVSKTESHYDFAIIDALKGLVDAQNAPDTDEELIDTQWTKGVGGEQLLLPGHIVDEYCSSEPFSPVPTFVSRPKPAKGLRQFYDWLSKTGISWFGADSEVGDDYAIYKGQGRVARVGRAGGVPREMDGSVGVGVVSDLTAVTALRETRTRNFKELEAVLESLLVVEDQLRPGI